MFAPRRVQLEEVLHLEARERFDAGRVRLVARELTSRGSRSTPSPRVRVRFAASMTMRPSRAQVDQIFAGFRLGEPQHPLDHFRRRHHERLRAVVLGKRENRQRARFQATASFFSETRVFSLFLTISNCRDASRLSMIVGSGDERMLIDPWS